jgi:hypothetical protein
LLALEDERWTLLRSLLDAVPSSRTDEPTVNPEGWSASDVVWHLACWNDFVRAQLETIRSGAFDEDFDWNTDEQNARFLSTGRSVEFRDAVSALETSRAAVVLAMTALERVPSHAIELFSEPAYRHIDDHVPELRRWLEAT